MPYKYLENISLADVAFEANVPAVKLRREMEQGFGVQQRSAA